MILGKKTRSFPNGWRVVYPLLNVPNSEALMYALIGKINIYILTEYCARTGSYF